MMIKDVLRDLIGYYVVVYCSTPEGNDFTVEGVLESINDDVFTLRAGRVRRHVSNVVVIQVIDFGKVDD